MTTSRVVMCLVGVTVLMVLILTMEDSQGPLHARLLIAFVGVCMGLMLREAMMITSEINKEDVNEDE